MKFKKINIVISVVCYGLICGLFAVIGVFLALSALSLVLLIVGLKINFSCFLYDYLVSIPYVFFPTMMFMSFLSILGLSDKEDNPFKYGILLICSLLEKI